MMAADAPKLDAMTTPVPIAAAVRNFLSIAVCLHEPMPGEQNPLCLLRVPRNGAIFVAFQVEHRLQRLGKETKLFSRHRCAIVWFQTGSWQRISECPLRPAPWKSN
jgi:hypothetical protein